MNPELKECAIRGAKVDLLLFFVYTCFTELEICCFWLTSWLFIAAKHTLISHETPLF